MIKSSKIKLAELKQLVREVVAETSQNFYKNELYIRSTGENRYGDGGMGRWFKIRKIEDEEKSFVFYVMSQGAEMSVRIDKSLLGKGHPNLAFKIRSMPATIVDVLHHYYEGNIPKIKKN